MVSYKPLFRYCLEHDITRADCRRICGISPNTWTKINRNEEVSMAILNKICAALGVSYHIQAPINPRGSQPSKGILKQVFKSEGGSQAGSMLVNTI